MTSITLILTGASIRSEVDGVLTSGMVGIPVTIRYDDAWNGLIKNLVCRCGKWGGDRDEIRTVLSVDETATVAHEVMKAGKHLYLGVEGYSTDGKLVIPTTWADCGVILYGANAGADPSTDPELSVWAQLQAQIEQIKQDTVTEEDIVAAVAAYMEENPIETPDSSQNVNNSDVGNIKIVLSNIMNILKAQVEDEDCTPQGYNMDVSGLVAQNDTLIAALGTSDDSGDSGEDSGGEDSGGTEKTLTSISVVYSGGEVAVGTAVTALTGIVVTAHYSDDTSETVTGYTMSGEIVEGSNTITVTYGGKNATFTVTGVAEESDLAQYEYTIAGSSNLDESGGLLAGPYNYTDFIEVDSQYDSLTLAVYLSTPSETGNNWVYSYLQWFNGETFLERVGLGCMFRTGDSKKVHSVAVPDGATKFRISVQNNCDSFALFKGTVTVDEV